MLIFLLLLVMILPLPGCHTMPSATGRDFEVVVMAGEDIWHEMKGEIRSVLEKPIFGVHTEKAFKVIQTLPDNPAPYNTWRKVLVVGSLEDTPILEELLDEEEIQSIEPGKAYLKSLSNVWAYGQHVLVFYTKSTDRLADALSSSSESVFSQINDMFLEEEWNRMFTSGQNREIEDYCAENYGFSFVLPQIYRLADEDTLIVTIGDEADVEMKAVRVFNLNPQRSFFVCWKDGGIGELETQKMQAIRQAIGRIYYPGDELLTRRVESSRTTFAGVDALRLRGVWENREELQGGVFLTYVFNCPENGRFYMIDGILYEPDPDKSKYPYLVQMSTILHSFECSADASRLSSAEEEREYHIDMEDLF